MIRANAVSQSPLAEGPESNRLAKKVRETLVMQNCVEECRFLVQGSLSPVANVRSLWHYRLSFDATSRSCDSRGTLVRLRIMVGPRSYVRTLLLLW